MPFDPAADLPRSDFVGPRPSPRVCRTSDGEPAFAAVLAALAVPGTQPPAADCARRIDASRGGMPLATTSGKISPHFEDVDALAAWRAPFAFRRPASPPTGSVVFALPAEPVPDEERDPLPAALFAAPVRPCRGRPGAAGELRDWRFPRPLPECAVAAPRGPAPRAIGLYDAAPPAGDARELPAAVFAAPRPASGPGRTAIDAPALEWLLVALAGPAPIAAGMVGPVQPRRPLAQAASADASGLVRAAGLALQVEYAAARATTARPGPPPGRGAVFASLTSTAGQVEPGVPLLTQLVAVGPVREAALRGGVEWSAPPPASAGAVIATGPFELIAGGVWWAGAEAGEVDEA